jgi:hypothetical protein
LFREFTPFSDREATQRKSANAFPKKAEGWVANGGGHAAHLAVFAFAEFKTEPGIDDAFTIANGRVTIRDRGSLLEKFGAAWKTSMPFYDDAPAAKLFKRSRPGFPFHEDEITTAVFEARIEETIFQGFLISEKEEAFGIHVKPPKRETSRWEIKLF